MSHIPSNTSAHNLASANEKPSSSMSDDISGSAPYTQTARNTPRVNTADDKELPFTSSASPTPFAPTVRDPLAFATLHSFGNVPHPSVDEPNTAYIYGMFDEPQGFSLLPNVNEEDEEGAWHFSDLALLVNSKIQELKRSSSFIEGLIESMSLEMAFSGK
ncbi:hypothetical protein BGX21_005672 [Mortierella sp. AD011]|nr:hypothetical protein BGX20_005625 [Mortierella sp. AD010]KAF9370138.1 hypothetical protein BGX21_005672 [Mortierella sp. AD011]